MTADPQPSFTTVLYAVVFSASLAGVSLAVTFMNGTAWREKYDALEARVKLVEKENARWHQLGPNPAVVQSALDNYYTIHEQLLIAESGRKYKPAPNKVVQCFTIEVPNSQQFYAGL